MAEVTLISNAAAGAYRSAKNLPSEGGSTQDAPSFSQMIADAGRDAVETVRSAETVAQSGLSGNAETQAVVEATLEMESTLRIAVSMRDKLVDAYREILNMPI